MEDEPVQDNPTEGRTTFRQRVAEAQREIEEELRQEVGEGLDESEITERAEHKAQFSEAADWLIERWGESFPCPVCGTVKWIVSNLRPAANGALSFNISCRYCGNTMQAIPEHGDLDEPDRGDQLPIDFPPHEE